MFNTDKNNNWVQVELKREEIHLWSNDIYIDVDIANEV
jgi:hypothetical protein